MAGKDKMITKTTKKVVCREWCGVPIRRTIITLREFEGMEGAWYLGGENFPRLNYARDRFRRRMLDTIQGKH